MRLPINRKEVYYTATVLPCIVCADNFAHFDRFWRLLYSGSPPVSEAPELAKIQFFTEYNMRDAIYTDADKTEYPGSQSLTGETPDLLIHCPPRMIGIEAKMFNRVSAGELVAQLKGQRDNVEMVLPRTTHFEQVALLPRETEITEADLKGTKLLHWERIIEEFSEVNSASYFLGELRNALDNYGALKSQKSQKGANCHAYMTGAQIQSDYAAGRFEFKTMGRQGGLAGAESDLAADVSENRIYEVRREGAPNHNWFPIQDFVAISRNLKREPHE